MRNYQSPSFPRFSKTNLRELVAAHRSRAYLDSHGSFGRYVRDVHGVSVAYAYKVLSGKKSPTRQLSDRTRWRIFERDNFTCCYCGSRRYLTVDHVVPQSGGGSDEDSNLITACKSCNSRKGT